MFLWNAVCSWYFLLWCLPWTTAGTESLLPCPRWTYNTFPSIHWAVGILPTKLQLIPLGTSLCTLSMLMRLYGTVPSPREGNGSSETLNFFTRFLYLSHNRLRIGSFSRILQRSLIRHLQVIITKLSFNSIHSSLELKSHWLSWAFRGSCFRPKGVLEKPHLMYEPSKEKNPKDSHLAILMVSNSNNTSHYRLYINQVIKHSTTCFNL